MSEIGDEPVVSDEPWDEVDEYAPAGPVEYEVSTDPEPPWPALVEPLEEPQTASERLRKARGRSAGPGVSRAPELDYGRDNGVGGVPWQKPCGWCGDIHGPSRSNQATRDRHFRYLRTSRNGGIAPIKKHGAGAYINWGCSCDVCCDANTEKAAKKRNKKLENDA